MYSDSHVAFFLFDVHLSVVIVILLLSISKYLIIFSFSTS